MFFLRRILSLTKSVWGRDVPAGISGRVSGCSGGNLIFGDHGHCQIRLGDPSAGVGVAEALQVIMQFAVSV